MGAVVRLARDGVDFLDHAGALKLRDMIVMYWRRRGFTTIDVRIHKQEQFVAGVKVGAYWVIRSNVGPKGFPPRA